MADSSITQPKAPSPQNRVVTAALAIITSKEYKYDTTGNRESGYLDDKLMDCSEFVFRSYRDAGYSSFPALGSHSLRASLKTRKAEDSPQAGDIVYWSAGHCGIVVDPEAGTFAGAQSSGLAVANFKYGWWASNRGVKSFLVYEGS